MRKRSDGGAERKKKREHKKGLGPVVLVTLPRFGGISASLGDEGPRRSSQGHWTPFVLAQRKAEDFHLW